MKTEIISNLFESGGLIIHESSEKSIFNFEYAEIITLFEKYGTILFRGFELNANMLTEFTDIYTEKYSGDALRREIRFNNKNIRNVDYGHSEVLLHSEASFTPSFPEIIWLYCNVPASIGGESTLCDGVRLWKMLSSELKGFFLSEQIQYELKIPVMNKKRNNVKKRPWLSQSIGAGTGYIDYSDGCLYVYQRRYAVQRSRIRDKYAFANHLFVHLDSEPQLLSRTLSDGSQIPDNIYEEIKTQSEKIIYEHIWEKNDLLMVDNKRFMHGRKSLIEGGTRDIVVVQTQRASFGYGSTTRKSVVKVS